MCYRRYAILIALLGLSACSTPLLSYRTDRGALVQTSLARAGITDGRQAYRSRFCAIVAAELQGANADCRQWLTQLADEPAAPPPAAPLPLGAETHPARDIVLVSGIFAECLGDDPKLLGDGVAMLEGLGYRVSYAPVRGRAGSDLNARIIRDHVLQQTGKESGRKAVIVSYSKGTADLVTALVAYPELADRIDAVVSMAGVVNGSPLADYVSDFYAATFAKLPYRPCPITDRGEMASISRGERQRWLSDKSLPPGILYFSIVGIPQPERVSALLKPFYDRLAYVDPLNDGQVLFYDAVLPGSTLLAYVNADHWAIALPFEYSRSIPLKALIDKNHFPRAQMLRAALATVEQKLASETTP